jgi:predicted nucleic acid-binding protein
MIAYWDTSAVLALILQEPHSPEAVRASEIVTLNYAWDWLRVEAESGLRRRQATEESFEALARHLQSFRWISLGRADFPAINSLNARHRLRAADAGHLYCLKQAAHILPEIRFVGFDRELTAAVQAEHLPVWTP